MLPFKKYELDKHAIFKVAQITECPKASQPAKKCQKANPTEYMFSSWCQAIFSRSVNASEEGGKKCCTGIDKKQLPTKSHRDTLN